MTKTLKGESRDWLSPLFCWLYAAMLLWVLGLVTLGQRAMEGYYAHGFCVENWVLLLAAAGLTGLWVWRLRVRPAKLPQPASSVRMSWARAALYLALFAGPSVRTLQDSVNFCIECSFSLRRAWGMVQITRTVKNLLFEHAVRQAAPSRH